MTTLTDAHAEHELPNASSTAPIKRHHDPTLRARGRFNDRHPTGRRAFKRWRQRDLQSACRKVMPGRSPPRVSRSEGVAKVLMCYPL